MKTLIKILCLSVLWFSCESFLVFEHEHDSICVEKYRYGSGNYTYNCYSNYNEFECLSNNEAGISNDHDEWLFLYDMTCEEFCEQCDDPDCEIH